MPKEYTLEEIGNAVDALHKSVEDGTFTEEKRERIEKVLDAYEDQNQVITETKLQITAHEKSIKAFKEELELKGTEAGQMREQIDALKSFHEVRLL